MGLEVAAAGAVMLLLWLLQVDDPVMPRPLVVADLVMLSAFWAGYVFSGERRRRGRSDA